MKQELTLWKKYLAHIEKLNKPIAEYNHKQLDDYFKRDKEAEAKFVRNEKRIGEIKASEMKKWDDWNNLPWYKKLFTPEPQPELLNHYRYPIWSTYPPFTKRAHIPTYEDFLTWASKLYSI